MRPISFSGKFREVIDHLFDTVNRPGLGWEKGEAELGFVCLAKTFYLPPSLNETELKTAIRSIEMVTLFLKHDKGIIISLNEPAKRQIAFEIRAEENLWGQSCSLSRKIDNLVQDTKFCEDIAIGPGIPSASEAVERVSGSM